MTSDSKIDGRQTPIVLETERLTLRLADPANEQDCLLVIRSTTDSNGSRGGNARVGINTIEDVREKHRQHGPKPELCTLKPPPYGIMFLNFVRPTKEELEAGKKFDHPEGTYVGITAMSFRREMPYPDLGYMILGGFEGHGYASEAGRRGIEYWRDEIGVREIFCGALEHNARSLRTAERIGFVRAGSFNAEFGKTDEDRTTVRAIAMVLPGMDWKDYDEHGNKTTVRPTVGNETEEQKNDSLSASARG